MTGERTLRLGARCGLITAAIASASGVVAPAAAQELVPVHVDYRAVAGCPSESKFVRRVQAHTQRLRRSHDPEALQLEVLVVKRGDRYVGRLVVSRGAEALGTRQFEEENCSEVVAALALSAALSVDPEAKLQAETELEPGEPGESTTSSSESTQPSQPPPPPETVPTPQQEPKPSVDDSESSTGVIRTWLVSVGPEFALGFALEPKAALGAGLSVGLHRLPDRTWFPLDGSVAFEYLTTRPTRGNDPLRMDWYTFRLDYCPLRAGNTWALLACSVGYGGWLSAEGVAIDTPRKVTRGFASLGLGLRGRATLAQSWVLYAGVDLAVPLTERSFAIDPDLQVVTSSRPVGAVSTVGVRWAF